jgi:hypothetical protein
MVPSHRTKGGRATTIDLVMRTLGVITCLYTVAYFVTSMSVAALNAATYNSGPMCGPNGCVALAREERVHSAQGRGTDSEPLWLAASFLQSD